MNGYELEESQKLFLINLYLYIIDRTDHDSMASKREAVAKAERAFKLFDKDNDGYITKEEFQKISKKLNKQQARSKRIAVIAFSNSLFYYTKNETLFLLNAQ